MLQRVEGALKSIEGAKVLCTNGKGCQDLWSVLQGCNNFWSGRIKHQVVRSLRTLQPSRTAQILNNPQHDHFVKRPTNCETTLDTALPASTTFNDHLNPPRRSAALQSAP